jgi:hypothetical protein
MIKKYNVIYLKILEAQSSLYIKNYHLNPSQQNLTM